MTGDRSIFDGSGRAFVDLNRRPDPEVERLQTLDAQLRELETSQVPQVPSAHVDEATNGAPEE